MRKDVGVSDGGPAEMTLTKYLSMGHLEWGVRRNDFFITQEGSGAWKADLVLRPLVRGHGVSGMVPEPQVFDFQHRGLRTSQAAHHPGDESGGGHPQGHAWGQRRAEASGSAPGT